MLPALSPHELAVAGGHTLSAAQPAMSSWLQPIARPRCESTLLSFDTPSCGLFKMTTLNELKLELAEVDQRLRTTWLRERELARKRIADIAVEFQISSATIVQDVESARRIAEPAPSMLRAPKVDLPLRSEGAVQYVEAKYRNAATGDSWTGRGPRPRWLREALDAGATLEEFLIDRGHTPATGDPLRAFQNAARRARMAAKP